MIRFSLVHSCELVETQLQSEACLVSGESWVCFFTLVILDPSEESCHGLWSLLYRGVYYGSRIFGPYLFLYWFRGLQSMVIVVLGHPSMVLSWFTSPHSSLYAGWGLHWAFSSALRCSYLQVSFSPDICDFLSSALGFHV